MDGYALWGYTINELNICKSGPFNHSIKLNDLSRQKERGGFTPDQDSKRCGQGGLPTLQKFIESTINILLS
jgi:hypothetical protein